jgi:RNA polymerase-binding transcription factor DksA
MVTNIVNKREELEAALSDAEAALAVAVVDAARIGTDRVAADAQIEKARSRCRQVRATLVKLNRAKYLVCADERSDAKVNQAAVAIPVAALAPGRAAARTQPPLLRQTVSLLGLTLAFLQYFFIDVQLQIVSLPSPILIG